MAKGIGGALGRRLFGSIRARLVVVPGAVVLLVFAALFATLGGMMRATLDSAEREEREDHLDMARRTVDNRLAQLRTTMMLVAGQRGLADGYFGAGAGDRSLLETFVGELLRVGEYSRVAALDAKGAVLASAATAGTESVPESVARAPRVAAVLTAKTVGSGGTALSELVSAEVAAAGDALVIRAVAPALDVETVVGTVVGEVMLDDSFLASVKALLGSGTEFALLVRGRLQASTLQAAEVQRYLEVAAAQSAEGFVGTDDTALGYLAKPLGGKDLEAFLIVGHWRTFTEGMLSRLSWGLLLGAGVASLLLIVTNTVMGARIGKALGGITRVAERLAAGQIKSTVVEQDRQDELGSLQASFARMVAHLAALVERAKRIAAGELGSEAVEKRLREGATASEVARAAESEGDLASAFAAMEVQLRILTVQARLIAREELSHPLLAECQGGELGEAFSAMVRNLRHAAEQAAAIAEGDLVSATVDQATKGELSEAFTHMVLSLRALVAEITEVSGSFLVAAEELVATNQQVAQGAKDQADQVGSASTAMNELATSIQQVATSTRDSVALAEKSNETVSRGREAVARTVSSMGQIHETVSVAAQDVRRLGERSREIGKIVDVISDIARQTNLLALNAAIEAARAGEQGKGFAVVADQVAKLAERSGRSAKEIAELIEEIQRSTQEVVQAMIAGTTSVEAGVRLADGAGAALADIEQVMHRMIAAVTEIGGVTRQQASTGDHVSSSLDQIVAVSRESAAATSQTLQRVESLREMAENLREAVSRFRVEEGQGAGGHGRAGRSDGAQARRGAGGDGTRVTLSNVAAGSRGSVRVRLRDA
ncbi:MAG: methyl-accepting chemotaxis protein [Candidatus Schekmanbacteria bacterium]|nr:methyl-accepting chemotaxis protein [Candidatus Schekmanbacteria bacterium]